MARPDNPRRPTSRSLLRADFEHTFGQPADARAKWWVNVVLKALLLPAVRGAVWLRVAQACANAKLTPLALFYQGRVQRVSGADIHPRASIGPGLCLMHSVGIVIGPAVRIGRDARIYHGVTLGDGFVPGQPTVGDFVTIGAGASVLGGVTIGDRVVIGAGALVTRDVPDDSVVRAEKATVGTRRPGADARLDELQALPAGSDEATIAEIARRDGGR